MQNNNESMATVVETFYVAETTNLIHDGEALAKWNEKVEELQLHGQKTVVKEDKSPIPFLWMNEAIINTFEVLCPTKVEIDKYDKTPIPLELLEAVSLCQKENYFDYMEVWYNEKQKDPVIVGYAYDQTKTESDMWYKKYYAKKYLVGRWADVKASLDTLIDRAKQLFIQNTKATLSQQIRDYKRHYEDVELDAERRFSNGMPSTSFPDLPF